MSRRNFLRTGIAVSAAAAGLTSIAESVEAKGEEAKLSFVGFNPSEHEKKLILMMIKKVVPSAVSVQVSLSDSGAAHQLSSIHLSIITSNSKVFEGADAGSYEKGHPITNMLNRALDRLEESK